VLHDIFAVPFDEIAQVVERSAVATRQLASRARRRVRGARTIQETNLASQRAVVSAFLTAAREDNFDALLGVLDPDVVFRHDPTAVPMGTAREVAGARAVAAQFAGRAQAARPILVNGAIGVVVAPRGQLLLVLDLAIKDGKITQIDVISERARLEQLDFAILGD
jgi:hypothetical protein